MFIVLDYSRATILLVTVRLLLSPPAYGTVEGLIGHDYYCRAVHASYGFDSW